jgi:hypothetical protein
MPTPRARRDVSPITVAVLRPLLRFSPARDAWVLRGIGRKHGPILQVPSRASQTRVA